MRLSKADKALLAALAEIRELIGRDAEDRELARWLRDRYHRRASVELLAMLPGSLPVGIPRRRKAPSPAQAPAPAPVAEVKR